MAKAKPQNKKSKARKQRGSNVLVNLKDRRREMALSQKQLAAMMEVHQPTLSRWESCKQRPSLIAAIRLAGILDTTVDDLTATGVGFEARDTTPAA